jgi:hypothetical protein
VGAYPDDSLAIFEATEKPSSGMCSSSASCRISSTTVSIAVVIAVGVVSQASSTGTVVLALQLRLDLVDPARLSSPGARCVAVIDRLDVVAVGVEHEGSVVALVIVRARAGLTVVLPACIDGRSVERVHLLLVLSAKGDVRTRYLRLTDGYPEVAARIVSFPLPRAETDGVLELQ